MRLSGPATSGPFGDAFRGRRVLVTGHTGFKGSWLCEWLLALGAEVTGIALEPNTTPALFMQLGMESRLHHVVADLRDSERVGSLFSDVSPDFVFHLAAQPLVRLSYEKPVETYEVNVMGTIHVLEALRALAGPCAAIFVTTDKCYENREWLHGYRESDPLGGRDPYSSSKAAAEIAIAAYRQSYFPPGHPVTIASARAGNVIGGGDWAGDRIVPDCIRALQQAQPVTVRNKAAVRPWQHVLEPLSGYLWLAARMSRDASTQGRQPNLCGAFNFGPQLESTRTVEELVTEVLRNLPGEWRDQSDPHAVHEATLLQLSIDKAHALLGWAPVWDFPTTVAETCAIYRLLAGPDSPALAPQAVRDQIARYSRRADELGRPWAAHHPHAEKRQ